MSVSYSKDARAIALGIRTTVGAKSSETSPSSNTESDMGESMLGAN